jgi:hypothetical protein
MLNIETKKMVKIYVCQAVDAKRIDTDEITGSNLTVTDINGVAAESLTSNTLAQLGDVNLTGEADGHLLRYNGSQWVNEATPAGDLVGTTATQTLSNKTLGTALNANGNAINNLAAPEAPTDAATREYVDDAFSVTAAVTDVATEVSVGGLYYLDTEDVVRVRLV